ncbi:hypothetical protein CEXT_303791 [Caerostris extrusa]|uniref:Uncharacterized protein n=1 Tax=Caerostris extrusa TaxID=172846 RepID=A0AAV4MQ98_CAEEX|nr:hypothetical protein CEXT_303791 [Caerostris extrusa]
MNQEKTNQAVSPERVLKLSSDKTLAKQTCSVLEFLNPLPGQRMNAIYSKGAVNLWELRLRFFEPVII